MKSFMARLFRAVPVPLVRLFLRLVNTRFTISVVGVFFTPDGRILLLRHVYRRLYPWGLPAGFLNAGESPEDAAVREVREEIGLIVKVTRTLDVQAVRPRHMEVVVLGTVLPDQPMRPNAEIFEGAFVPPGVLPPGMMPSQAEIVRRAVAVHVSGPVLSTEV